MSFRPGEGRECTFPASLAAAAGADYDWVMGCSGAAFDASIDAIDWEPLAASPQDAETMSRAARAAAVRLDPVSPPFDDEMRELVLERVIEAIDTKLPPLVRGIAGPPEFGLIVGYDDAGPRFECRTYFDKGGQPTRIGWDAFVDDAHGLVIFLDRAPAADRVVLAAEALRGAPPAAEHARVAVESWVAALRDDARWTDTRHAGSAAFADHAMRAILHDRRAAAARFLRALRAVLAGAPGGDVLRAAESYDYAAAAIARGGLGPFDGTVAMRFLDPGHRRGWAKQLESALAHEAEGREAIAAAAARLR